MGQDRSHYVIGPSYHITSEDMSATEDITAMVQLETYTVGFSPPLNTTACLVVHSSPSAHRQASAASQALGREEGKRARALSERSPRKGKRKLPFTSAPRSPRLARVTPFSSLLPLSSPWQVNQAIDEGREAAICEAGLLI